MHANRIRSGVVLVSVVALAPVVATGGGGPWRTALAVWFVLVCPGASLVGVLGLRDRFVEMAMVAPLSLAVVALTSIALFYGGVWSPGVEFGLLLVLCVAGLAWSQLGSRHDVKGDA